MEGFDRAMTEPPKRERASWKGAAKRTPIPAYQQLRSLNLKDIGRVVSNNCEVLAIIKNGQGHRNYVRAEESEVILDHTPFYAESGGQVGDRGWLYSDDHNTVVAEVKGCYYPVQGVRAHQVVVKSPPNENRVGWGTLRSAIKLMPSSIPTFGNQRCANPHRDSSAAGRAARSAGQACQAGGIVGSRRIICVSTSRTSPALRMKNCRTFERFNQ